MVGAWATLTGQGIPTDKNNVIKGLTWRLTGNRKTEYGFKGKAPEQNQQPVQSGESGQPALTSAPPSASTPPPTSGPGTCDLTCDWAGHCAGASCSGDNECTGELTCNNGQCGCPQ